MGADIAVVKIVNDRLVERIVKTESSAGKTLSIPSVTLWKLLAFRVLLIIVSLRKRCVVSLKRLVSKLTNGIFKPVIAWKRRRELLLNLLTGKIVSKFLGWRRILNPLTRRTWTFLRAQKLMLMSVYIPSTEASGINAKNLGQFRKYTSFIELVVWFVWNWKKLVPPE